MANKYLSYISDDHLLYCIGNMHAAFSKAKANVTKERIYGNKLDVVKLTFDSKFSGQDVEQVIKAEIIRQIDKTFNNSIGTFHEEILGGVNGYEKGNLSGYDIKANDNSVFADIKNKHNTMNSSSAESLFQKLAHFADTHKHATCYWVQILAKYSFDEPWKGDINGKEYSHSRVRKISGDQFYKLVTGEKKALYNLYKALPIAISDYLNTVDGSGHVEDSAFDEIQSSAVDNERTIIDQITFENFGYYLGFDSL